MSRRLPAWVSAALGLAFAAAAIVPPALGRDPLVEFAGARADVTTATDSADSSTLASAEGAVGAAIAATTPDARVNRSSGRTAPHKAEIPRPPGVRSSCSMTHRFPEKESSAKVVSRVQKIWKVRLVGDAWTQQKNRAVLTTMWQTLDAVDCTPFLSTIATKNKGRVTISGDKSGSWAWGDYGYTKPNAVSLNLGKMATGLRHGEGPRVVRVMVHELGHAWSTDRGMDTGYWSAIESQRGKAGAISSYGAQGSSENFAEAVGYFVARCAVEADDTDKSRHNPYDDDEFAGYYKIVRSKVFGGRTFGPAAGLSC